MSDAERRALQRLIESDREFTRKVIAAIAQADDRRMEWERRRRRNRIVFWWIFAVAVVLAVIAVIG